MSRVIDLSVAEYHDLSRRGVEHVLVDVRTPAEVAVARIDGARLLDEDAHAELSALPRDTRLVFVCHHGIRSHAAARAFASRGFAEVYNVVGGIERWSLEIDPRVPRY